MDPPFLLGLYRLARESAPEHFPVRALQLLQGRLPFDSGRWLRSTYVAPRSITVHEAFLWNDSPEMLKAHEQVIDQNEPNWKAVRSAHCGPLAFAYNSAATFNTPATAEIRRYQSRYEHENTLNVLIKRRLPDRTHYRMIALHRARPDNQFTRGEVSQMRSMLPHFIEALAINSVIGHSAHARPSSSCIGIADHDRSFLFAEERLRELLQAEWPDAEPGKVPLRLWEGLSRDGRYAGPHLVAQAGESHGMLVVRVRARCAADSLSPRELQAARLDGAGFTYKEIARQMGTAPATARNVLQRVHEKLAVRNRGEVNGALSPLD